MRMQRAGIVIVLGGSLKQRASFHESIEEHPSALNFLSRHLILILLVHFETRHSYLCIFDSDMVRIGKVRALTKL